MPSGLIKTLLPFKLVLHAQAARLLALQRSDNLLCLFRCERREPVVQLASQTTTRYIRDGRASTSLR
jgi:hypothetical protein